jgi:hypothetical protein
MEGKKGKKMGKQVGGTREISEREATARGSKAMSKRMHMVGYGRE